MKKREYIVFLGDAEKVILFKKALNESRLSVDNENISLCILAHNGSNHAEICVMSEEYDQIFLSAFRYSGLFGEWAGKLAKIS